MLILGRKHKFTKFEKQRLRKQKIKTIIVRYRGQDPKEVLEQIKSIINEKKIKTIVLNTKEKVDDEIIRYLTKLQFEDDIYITSTEQFLEKYLQKCYIPDDNKDLANIKALAIYSKKSY